MDHRPTAMTIGDVAKASSVSVHTLRYYERVGLMGSVGRKPNGHRVYGSDDLHWVSLVRCLRATGMTIADIKRFSRLVAGGTGTVPDRIALLDRHRAKLVADLEVVRETLGRVDEKLAKYRSGSA